MADTFPASDPTTGDATSDQDPVRVAVVEHEPRHVRVGDYELTDGSVVIAAITSCTNTSNPQVMVAAGLLAKKAVELGLERKPWVKSSLAPGSKVVTEYYEKAGLDTLPRPARLQHGRLRLHDVHRQLGAASGRDLGGGRRRAISSSAQSSPGTATSRRGSIPR